MLLSWRRIECRMRRSNPRTGRCARSRHEQRHASAAFLLLLVTAISAAFVAMIRAFLLTILLAAISA